MARIKEFSSQDFELKPTDILAPPDQIVSTIPVETRDQELPFHSLTWQNFERLCYRLAGHSSQAESWQRYGRQGQAQGGIDIFVRRNDGRYDVWQCKRHKKVTASIVKDAVRLFWAGEWKKQTVNLFMCVAASLNDVKVQAAIESQGKRLRLAGITFHVYGAERLSEELKLYPDLVDDFFGREWVRVFNGDTAVKALSMRQRLDGASVARVRQELFRFYSEYFRTLDTGLISAISANQNVQEPPGLLERFVIPDVLIRETVRAFTWTNPTRNVEARNERNGHDEPSSREDKEKFRPSSNTEQTLRRTLDEWMTEGSNAVVLGDAGSGKTTLLRFLALDLLSGHSALPELARKWGQLLPILIPFTLWTQMAAAQPTGVPLEEMFSVWLKRFSVSADLVDLVHEAIMDGRVLLLVDGLDEWANETAARTVFAQLETVVKTHAMPAFLSGRPLGVEKLGSLGRLWRIGTLAPLSESQQHRLARIWFGALKASMPGVPESNDAKTHEHFIDWQISNFFKDLREGARLHALAGIPLLLTGLISLRIRQIALPRNRFQIYDELTKILLELHPQERSMAAAETTPRFRVLSDPEYRRRAIARLAYEIHLRGIEGGFPVRDAERIIVDFLRDENEVGLSAEQARAGANELTAVNAETRGILIEKYRGAIGFVHAVFEEHLAAVHLAACTLGEQKERVVQSCSDVRWRNVILGLFRLLTRPSDVDELIEQIEKAPVHGSGEVARRLLLAEIAFGESNRTARIAKRIAATVFEQIETGFWMPERFALLRIAMEGFGDGALHDELQQHIDRWYPDTQWSREPAFEIMGTWTRQPIATETLWRGLFDLEMNNRRAAARAIAMACGGDPDVGRRLLATIRLPIAPEIAARMLDALALGWPAIEGVSQIVDAARASRSPELRIAGIRAAIEEGRQTDGDRETLLRIAQWRYLSVFEFHGEIVDALVRGWPQSPEVFETCWNAWTGTNYPREKMDKEIAEDILLLGYADNDQVVAHLCGLLTSSEDHFSGMREHWGVLKRSFEKHPLVGPALDVWAKRRLEKGDFFVHYAARAAVVSRTDRAKEILLSRLETAGNMVFWPVGALLEGWGMSDPGVRLALTKLADASPECVQHFAHYLPDIISDRNECRSRLLSIARLQKVERPDLVVTGFARINADHTDKEVIDAVWPLAGKGVLMLDPSAGIISQFWGDPRVRDLAHTLVFHRDAPLDVIASAYRDDQEILNLAINRLSPLPDDLRQALIGHAARRCDEFPEFDKLISRYDDERQGTVRTAAEAAYFAAITRRGGDINGSIGRLTEEVRSIGPMMEELRQSAFAGLISLNDVQSFADLKERDGKSLICIPALEDSIHSNPVLVEQIATHWHEISAVLGTTAFSRLSMFGRGNEAGAWRTLARYASVSNDLQDAFLVYCEQTGEPLDAESLRVLARLQHGSRLLLRRCKQVLELASNNPDISSYESMTIELTAGSILGTVYRSEKGLKDFLEPLARLRVAGAIVALCLGWPESPDLDRTYVQVRTRKPPHLPWPAILHVVSQRGDAEAFEGVFDDLLDRTDGNIWFFLPDCIPPITRRLAQDKEIYERFLRRLFKEPSLNEKASLPRLLSLARSGDQSLRKWCEDEIVRQMEARHLSDYGLDMVAGRVRPVAQVLLDVCIR